MGSTDGVMGWIVGPMSLVLAATLVGQTAKVCRCCTHLRASHRVHGAEERDIERGHGRLAHGGPFA